MMQRCLDNEVTVADIGATAPQTPVATLGAPLFSAHGSRNRDKKYSKIKIFFP